MGVESNFRNPNGPVIAEDEGTRSRDVYYTLGYRVRAQLLGILGVLPTLGFPIWWGLLESERHYDLLGFGLVQTSQIAGWVVVNLFLLMLLRRTSLNGLAAGCFVVIALGYLSVIVVSDVRAMIVILFCQAAAAGGTASLSGIYLGHTRNPERQFAIQTTLTTLTMAGCFLVLPVLFQLVGNVGIQIIYAAIALTCAAIVLGLPANIPGADAHAVPGTAGEDATERRPIWIAGVPIIAAYALFASFLTMTFNYSPKIGTAHGIPLAAAGSAVSLGMVIGCIGGMLGIVLGRRIGRVVPVMFGAAMGCVMFLLLHRTGMALRGFGVAMVVFGFIYNFVNPYITAQIMAVDPRGRLMVTAHIASSLGGVMIAGIVTALSVLYGVTSILWVIFAEILMSAAFFLLSDMFSRKMTV